jgi:hypothetical protein
VNVKLELAAIPNGFCVKVTSQVDKQHEAV